MIQVLVHRASHAFTEHPSRASKNFKISMCGPETYVFEHKKILFILFLGQRWRAIT